MSDELVTRIRTHALSQPEGLPFAKVSDIAIQDAESKLGFGIAPLLKACYVEVGNGGFGPGYGLIGLEGGAQSDFGSLADTYVQLKSDHESEGDEWPTGLLPFCSFGCNIFPCVDCLDNKYTIHLFEEGDVSQQPYNLQRFFELWIEGVDLMSLASGEIVERDIVNPFTGEKTSVSKRTKD